MAPLSKPLMLQDSFLTIAMMHLQGVLMQAHMQFAAYYVVSPVSREGVHPMQTPIRLSALCRLTKSIKIERKSYAHDCLFMTSSS